MKEFNSLIETIQGIHYPLQSREKVSWQLTNFKMQRLNCLDLELPAKYLLAEIIETELKKLQ